MNSYSCVLLSSSHFPSHSSSYFTSHFSSPLLLHSLLNHRLALRLVQLEDEKHPTFLDNRLLEGVELTYAFQVPSPHPYLTIPNRHTTLPLVAILYFHVSNIPPYCIPFYPTFLR